MYLENIKERTEKLWFFGVKERARRVDWVQQADFKFYIEIEKGQGILENRK